MKGVAEGQIISLARLWQVALLKGSPKRGPSRSVPGSREQLCNDLGSKLMHCTLLEEALAFKRSR